MDQGFSLRRLRWHAAQLLDWRNLVALPAVLLLLASPALVYVVINHEEPRVAKLQAEVERLRAEITSGNIRGPNVGESSSSISTSPATPSNLFARVGISAKLAGLSSIGLSMDAVANSSDAEQVSLRGRGTYVQSKAFLAALLNDSKVTITELELRGSELAQMEIRIAIAANPLKVE